MRFPSRLVLAGAVLAALATSGATALTMPGAVENAAVAAPDAAAPPAPPPGEGAGAPQDPAPAPAPVTPSPPVTGEQIAALVVAPARDRAAALIAEQRAEARAEAERQARQRAEREANQESENDRDSRDNRDRQERWDDWGEMSPELREACEEDRIEGLICRGH